MKLFLFNIHNVTRYKNRHENRQENFLTWTVKCPSAVLLASRRRWDTLDQ
jgi:hypothetical protein